MNTYRKTSKPDSVIYLIGNAHLDPVWMWKWSQGFAEVKATFLSVLDRMKEYPDFKFTSSSARYYTWVEENAPEMFAEITQRVKEGRWNIVGGWWVEPDCNIPCGESFVRQGLYSQRYFFKKFGAIARTGYNIDSFGHNGMLPQILSKSGMTNYVFMRPAHDEKDLPGCLFWWESPDGSRVLTFRIPFCYNQEWGDPKSNDSTEKQKLIFTRDLSHKLGYDLMGFYGVGNHGGGPTIENLKMIKNLKDEWGDESMIMSSTDEYFNNIRKRAIELPTVRDELQYHAKGTYSAHSRMKKINRLAEQRLMASEKYCALAQNLFSHRYPSELFERAWKLVLFNQFHDIITGCSIKEAYDDAFNLYGEALSIVAEAMNAAIQKISWSIDTTSGENIPLTKESDWILWEYDNKGVPLVIFNALSWGVKVPIQIHRNVRSILSEKGEIQTLQLVRAPQINLDDKWDTLFIASIPAMGYSVYRIFKNLELQSETSPGYLSISKNHIENNFIRLEVDSDTGFIKRIYDKINKAEVLSGPGAMPVVIDETDSDTWAHFIFEFDRVIGQFGNAEIKVLESGPLRVRLRVKNNYGNSTLQQDFMLYHDRPEIHVKANLDWREKHRMLKLNFPVNVKGAKAVYEIPYGFIERPSNGHEEPAQQWVDVNGIHPDTCKTYGFALLNDCKYSFSVSVDTLSMTVVRSPIYADHFGYAERDDFCEFMDQIEQEFSYVILPHEGNWKNACVVKKAWEMNATPQQVIETYHKGVLGLEMEGIRISEDNIIASVFKLGEEGGCYILRCYETNGESVEASIHLPLINRHWRCAFGPCEIKTFLIPSNPEISISETSLIEMEV